MSQIRRLLRSSLKKQGYNVILAKNGKEALKYAFDENPPDLIVLDINMPEMNGYEVIKQIRDSDNTKDIPVIFLTAKAEKKDSPGAGPKMTAGILSAGRVRPR